MTTGQMLDYDAFLVRDASCSILIEDGNSPYIRRHVRVRCAESAKFVA